MNLALGIDVGTSGVRTAVMESDRLIAMARADHPPQNPAHIDANGWWQAVETSLERQMVALAERGRDPGDIRDIAVDGTSGSMVLTDRALNPVSPALMYNSKGFDAEAAQISAQITGTHITKGSNSALARAMRLVTLAKAPPAHLLHQADFISAKLSGGGGNSDDNNALKTGFDPASRSWPDWIGAVIDPDLLPQVHSPGTPVSRIDPNIARRFGINPEACLHAGTTDSIAAFLAAAPLQEGVAVTSLGSTLAIKLLCREPINDPAVGLYSHRLGDLWLVGGASNTGGAVLKKHFSDDELTRLSQQIDPQIPSELKYYPLNEPGERFPINDPDLKPVLQPRPSDDAAFLHAMLEGIAAIEARCYHEIRARGGPFPTRIFTAGGGAKNTTWTRIRARILGQTPRVAEFSEAAIGSARLATATV